MHLPYFADPLCSWCYGFVREPFLASLESGAMRKKVKADFSTTQSLGVGGFPTLGVAYEPQVYLVTSGFVTDEVLESRLAQIDRLAASRA
jgi:putative protein-disulfide isomerase